MKNRRRRGYKFTEKKHSKRGILAAVLASALLVWYGLFVELAFLAEGALSVYYGSAGVIALLLAVAVLVLAAVSMREEDSFLFFPRLGFFLALLALACWSLTYLWGWIG